MIGPRACGSSTRPVEERLVVLAPDRQLHLVRAVAETVVVDIILEALRHFRDRKQDQLSHRLVGAVEQGLQRREVGLLAEALAELDHATLSRTAAGNDCEQVSPVHLGQADVVEDQFENVVLRHPPLEDFQRRNDDPLLEDRLRAGRKRSRQGAARVHLMAELARPADQLVLEEDRNQHEPIVRVRDRGRALERVGGEDHVTRVDATLPLRHHLVDIGPELAHDHAPTRVGDHRELVVLLADDGAHRRPEEDGVHLEAGALERAFDDVECDRVDLDVRNLGDAELFGGCHLSLAHSLGVIRMLKLESTVAR